MTVPLLVGHLRVSRSGRLGSPLLGAIGAEDAGASRGLRWRENAGVLAGYPMVDIKATLIDGAYHEVDSSEMAF
ncbi:MAG: hypothetical protein ACFNKE_09955, partial [Neisseria elongata]